MQAKMLAAIMAVGLLPLAGCAAPRDHYASGYAGYQSGPYDSYDPDYDDRDAGYGPPPAPSYGQASGQPYGPNYSGSYYGQTAPAYPAPTYGQAYYGQSCCGAPSYGAPSYGATNYGAGYSSSGYSSSYYSAPPVRYPAPPSQPSYYSTYYGCSCGR